MVWFRAGRSPAGDGPEKKPTSSALPPQVAIRKSLQLMLVESNPEDEQLVCEALIEIDEGRHWRLWHSCGLVNVDLLSEALECLRKTAFDASLSDLELPEGDALLESLHEARSSAKETA